MRLEVAILDKEIKVDCFIDSFESNYAFSLASSFKIDEIINNGRKITDIHDEECYMQFRPAMKQYIIRGLEKGDLKICYSGTPVGNFAFMTDAFIHFSFYNGWYPIEKDIGSDYVVAVLVNNEYEVLHAVFDPNVKRWIYTMEDDSYKDCNIMCIHKESVFSLKSDDVSVYWFDTDKKENSEVLYCNYKEICNYYRELYRNNKINHTDIVFVPGDYNLGAYMRKNLIVFSDMGPFTDYVHVLAHEIGHAYASGANVDTYNDWLKETHAEWSALLYLEKHKPMLFSELERKMEADSKMIGSKLCLRECGDKRPDNVHTTGTLIYHQIYKRFGREAIKELLRIFDMLQRKDTDSFLECVAEYNHDVSDLIKTYL